MRLRKLITGLSMIAGAAALVLATGGIAHASQQAICGNGGSGYCINDWGGGGNGSAVNMYYGGSSNEDFHVVLLSGMCNHGYVTSTCPGGNTSAFLNGDALDEVQYANTGSCVAATSGGKGVLGTCANSAGNGGATGVIDLGVSLGSNCNSGNQEGVANRHYTDINGAVEGWLSGGGVGTPLYLDSAAFTCWGGL